MKKIDFKPMNMIFLMQTEPTLVKAFEEEGFRFLFNELKVLIESNCLNHKAFMALKKVFKKQVLENLEMLEKFNSIVVERSTAKYILIHVEERNGEREYTSKIVRQIDGSIDAHNWADENIAKTWLDFDSEENEKGYFFNGGEFLVHISKIEEITKEEFDVISKYF